MTIICPNCGSEVPDELIRWAKIYGGVRCKKCRKMLILEQEVVRVSSWG